MQRLYKKFTMNARTNAQNAPSRLPSMAAEPIGYFETICEKKC